jgi:hypothetical protein
MMDKIIKTIILMTLLQMMMTQGMPEPGDLESSASSDCGFRHDATQSTPAGV